MTTETEQIIREQMKQYGVELEINKNFHIEGNTLSVECDLDIQLGLDWIDHCILTKITKRNTKMHVTFRQQESKLVLTFVCQVPKEFTDNITRISPLRKYCTTFPDFCWLSGEGTTNTSLAEVATVPRDSEQFPPGDLLWALPSRFADDLIEMVHTINPEFMSGLMQDAIIYGPYVNYV